TQSGEVAQDRDQFGFAIADSQDQLAIGAPATDSGNSGRVFLYQHNTGKWRVVRSPSPSPNDGFGSALTFVDSTLVIGAPGVGKVFKLVSPRQPPVDFGPAGFAGLGASLAAVPGGVLVGAPKAGNIHAQPGEAPVQ